MKGNRLSWKEEKFVELYTGPCNGNATEAILQAGYNCDRDVARAMGAEYLAKPTIKRAIEAKKGGFAAQVEAKVQDYLRVLHELLDDERTPQGVRAKIAQDLLDRAGHVAKKELSLGGNGEPLVMETRHTADIAKRAREALQAAIYNEEDEADADEPSNDAGLEDVEGEPGKAENG